MHTFNDWGLKEELLRSVNELGFISPTPIQELTIPAILNSTNDLIGLAQTGTGKTAGFGLPIINNIDRSNKTVQALILCPTRELCLQIAGDFEKYAKYLKGISILSVYGGVSIVPQIRSLKSKVQIVIGTPGRTLDLIRRKSLDVTNIKWLVLDEADEMLNMGFKDDLDKILSGMPADKQSLLFSATMPSGVRRIADSYLNSPEEISVGKRNSGAENIEHHYYIVKAADKYLALKRIADINPGIYGIIFCRTRAETRETASRLMQDGYNADALHGDLSQAQRDDVMKRFRKRQLQLLVATDVAARGLDVKELTHIINFNLPDDPEVYIHRTGRTGRAGKKGLAISLTHSREGKKINELEKLTGKKFDYKKVPGGKEICEKRLFTLISRVEHVDIDDNLIGKFLPGIFKKLEWLSREDLIRHFVTFEFQRFLEYYKDAPDLNIAADSRKTRTKSGKSIPYSKFYINLGTKSGINASSLIGLINEATDRNDIRIGKVDVQRNFSFFEAEKNFESAVLAAFKNTVYIDTPLKVTVSTEKNNKSKSGGNFKKRKTNQGRNKKNTGHRKQNKNRDR